MGSCVTTTDSDHTDKIEEHEQTANEQKIEEHEQIANEQKIKEYEELLNGEKIDIDLSIYCEDNDNSECDGKYDDDDDVIELCVKLKRITFGLKVYESLDILNNKKHNDMFMNFINGYNGIYYQFIDDYIHLINDHNEHLYKINELLTRKKNNIFKSCKISKCQFSARHHDVNKDENENKNELDETFNFYKESMDSLHFYLFHLWDTGLRAVKGDDDENKYDEEERKGDEYFDAEFNRLHKILKQRQHITASFGRFKNYGGCNKFNIKTNVDEKTKGDNTFLDELYIYLKSLGVDYECINNLQTFIKSQQFDSDAVEQDIHDNDDGNISQHIQNKKCIESIKQFMDETKSRSVSFSIGYRFYYWPYYAAIDRLQNEKQWNINNHNGYKVRELLIKQKYSTFKQEIHFYAHFDILKYKAMVIKANKYKDTDIVRATKPHSVDADKWMELHYDIAVDQVLGFNNLCALILYCDYTELSSNFSSSFRKIL